MKNITFAAIVVILTAGCIAEPDVQPPANLGSDAGDTDLGEQPDMLTPDVSDQDPDADMSQSCSETCAGQTPFCHPDRLQCVQCIDDAYCTGGYCGSQDTCVRCTANDHCGFDAPFCDPSIGDCTTCRSDEHCARFEDAPACSRDECVECTGTNYTACEGVCDSLAQTCTNLPAGSAGACDECVSDAQCGEGMKCVPDVFENQLIGYFCTWELAFAGPGGPSGNCANVPPYLGPQELTTIDGAELEFCTLRFTTCAGNRSLGDTCDPAAQGQCGLPGVMDAACVTDGLANYCSPPCVQDDDCRGPATCHPDRSNCDI